MGTKMQRVIESANLELERMFNEGLIDEALEVEGSEDGKIATVSRRLRPNRAKLDGAVKEIIDRARPA